MSGAAGWSSEVPPTYQVTRFQTVTRTVM